MKRIILTTLTLLFLVGCNHQPPLKKVVNKRFNITKGMTKVQVQKTLQVKPDEISTVGNTTIWIYKGILGNEQKRFNDFIIKFINNKVAYTGFFQCKLPKEE